MKADVDCMVVEDSATQALELQQLLLTTGYSVKVARNGREALELLKELRPRVIISDIVMPEINGYELCRKIKADPNLQGTHLMLLTTLSDPEDIFRALECGADNFVTKSSDKQTLLSRIGFIIANQQVRDDDAIRAGLEISFGGRKQFITAGRLQVLNLLLSTYDAVVEKSRDLERATDALHRLNAELEQKVEQRTAHLNMEIEQRKAAESRLIRQHQFLRMIESTATLANSNGALDETILDILEQSCTTMNWPLGQLQIFPNSSVTGSDGERVYWHPSGNGNELLPPAVMQSITESLASQSYLPQQRFWVADLSREMEAYPVQNPPLPGPLAMCSVPVTIGGELIGALQLFNKAPTTIDEEMLTALEQVGIQLARLLERDSAARALEKREKFLDAIINCDKAYIYVKGRDGRYLTVNHQFAEFYGRTRESMVGLNDFDLVPGPVAEEFQRYDQMVFEAEEAIQMERHITVNGLAADHITVKFPLYDEYGRVYAVCGHSTDITNIKRTAREKELLALAFEQSEGGMSLLEPSGSVIYVNHALRNLIGKEAQQVESVTAFDLGLGEVSGKDLLETWNRFTARNDERFDGVFIDNAGEAPQYRRLRISRVYDGQQTVSCYMFIAYDITEERKLESQLRKRQRIESLGTLAGGIAHDFNNVLAAVIGFSELAAYELDESHVAHSYVESITKAGARAQNLVKQILRFSRPDERAFAPTKVGLVLMDVIELLKVTTPAYIQLKVRVDPRCTEVMADATQLHQVFMNLGTNARHAIGNETGTISFTIEPFEVSADTAALHPDLRLGAYVRAIVSDTGSGIDKETLEHVFDPFFTTKAPGEGTGLGLSICHRILKDHKGAITVYSEINRGTTFNLYLPIASEAEVGNPTGNVESYPGGNEHVVVVDDEELLAKLAKRKLERMGYTVTTFDSPVVCLQEIQERPRAFDLVLTDESMPGMVGQEFARQIQEINPLLPVILTSGYHDHHGDQPETPNVAARLTKPISDIDLYTEVRRALDRVKDRPSRPN